MDDEIEYNENPIYKFPLPEILELLYKIIDSLKNDLYSIETLVKILLKKVEELEHKK